MILKQAYNHKRRIAIQVERGQAEHQPEQSTSMRQGLEVIKSFALIIGVFAFSLLPAFIVSQYISHDPMKYLVKPGIGYVIIVSNTALLSNNIVNPIIYALKFKAYKKAFKALIRCKSDDSIQ